MPEYKWPEAGERKWIGKRVSRSDGPDKVSGRAKYSYDVNLNGMLYGAILRSPYAHARIKSIDTSAAEALPGVKAVHVVKGPGTELQWAGAEIVGVAAVSEEVLEDALREIKVEYEKLPHLVPGETLPSDQDRLKPVAEQQQGEPDRAFEDADVVHEGYYGIPVITHCCLESHGMVVRWEDDTHLTAWVSTQNVSGLAGQFAEADGVGVEAGNVRIVTPHMGGGFGSKFGIDVWGRRDGDPGQADRRAGQDDAAARRRTDGGRRAAFLLQQHPSGGQEGRNAYRVGVGYLGNLRCEPSGRRAAAALRVQNSPPEEEVYGGVDQHRRGPRLARSQSSSGLRSHDGCAGRLSR